jgi:hypothetical protein
MSLFGLIDRLDDRINPIVVKELRQAVKSRLVAGMLLVFLGLQMLVAALVIGTRPERLADPDFGSFHPGRDLFQVLQVGLLGACMMLIPIYASVRLSLERSDTNVDLLFISTLKPRSIISGKFFSALVLVVLVFSCCLPFLTFAYLLRGIDVQILLLVLALDAIFILLSLQACLFLASIPVPRMAKIVILVLAFFQLFYLFVFAVMLTEDMIRQSERFIREDVTWTGIGLAGLFALCATALLFCWSVALISPPSANRALPGRICLVAISLVTGGICWFLAFTTTTPSFDFVFVIWAVMSVSLFCLQFVISMNEREWCGNRVARTIPRFPLFRPLAFLFYSGSAGGVMLSALGVGTTILAYGILGSLIPPRLYSHEEPWVSRCVTMFLYTYCYALSAVLLRYYLLRDRINVEMTWVLGALLLGLGMSVPWILGFAIHYQDFGRTYGLEWWNLGNPFYALHMTSYSEPERDKFMPWVYALTGVWAILLTLLAVPWAVHQIARFHPPKRTPPKKEEEILMAQLVEPETAS